MNKADGKYEVRVIGGGPLSREGKVQVAGYEHKGLFDVETGVCVLCPAHAVDIQIQPRRLIAWRVEQRATTTGIGRADYDWIIESYRRPDLALEWSHVAQDRSFTDYHWPNHLATFGDEPDRVVSLNCGCEEGIRYFYLVRRDDDSIAECDAKAKVLTELRRPRKPPLVLSRISTPLEPSEPLLREVLDRPEDDEARLRYADSLTSRDDPRGGFIRLQIERTRRQLRRDERQRERSLLAEHGRAWSEPLGVIRSGQVWERGFLVEAQAGTKHTPEALAHPEWRLMKRLLHNMAMPHPDLMDSLEDVRGFNLAHWFAMREKPWTRLRTLVAREKELALLDRLRFPSLERLLLYSCVGLELRDVVSFAGLTALELIGQGGHECGYDLESAWPIVDGSPLRELVVAPHQGAYFRAVFTRTGPGSSWALAVNVRAPAGKGADVLRTMLFAHLPLRSLASVEISPPREFDVSPWCE